MGTSFVKRAYWPGPVILLVIAGLGGTVACGFFSSLPVCAVVQAVSSWSARSRAAARTNELDAGKRRPIIEGEEEPAGGWRMRKGDLAAPVRGWSEWSHMHPFGTCLGAGCHDRAIQGPGCSVRSSSAVVPAHATVRARPGPGDPLRVGEQVVGAGE